MIYRGGIPHSENLFILDKHHLIQKGRMFPVCGNTYRMLNESRFAVHFEFFGNREMHYGIYDDCGTSLPFERETTPAGESGGCC